MRAWALLPFVATLAPSGAFADAVDCDGAAVFVGQGAVDLLARCGEPSFREERVEERSTFALDSTQRVSEVHILRVRLARWTYDFGPARFLQFVTLENGRIVAVERGSYGSAMASPRPERVSVARCGPERAFHVGDSMYEVLSRCGDPVSRELKQLERRISAAGTDPIVYVGTTVVEIETWTYNFGARAFQRKLKFVDGKLAEIATGTYGYD